MDQEGYIENIKGLKEYLNNFDESFDNVKLRLIGNKSNKVIKPRAIFLEKGVVGHKVMPNEANENMVFILLTEEDGATIGS